MTSRRLTNVRGGSEECPQGLKPISFSLQMSEALLFAQGELKLRLPNEPMLSSVNGGF